MLSFELNQSDWIHLAIILCIAGIVLGILLYGILKSPFRYPYYSQVFDVTGKRLPEIYDSIDNFLICGGMSYIHKHEMLIEQWKIDCENRIKGSTLKKYRRKQFLRAVDPAHAYKFSLNRTRTAYRQRNYQRYPYKIETTIETISCSYKTIQKRDRRLAELGYACPLSQYERNAQRNLMTRALREQIMKRDNYTCQICGKYMPDEVGLQIDHIVPVSKGGKSIPTNLQVLCSKCNGRKSNRIMRERQ